jgi:two-component system OmpR family response regulator
MARENEDDMKATTETSCAVRKRVLLIDDDTAVRGALRDIVIALGYDAEAAASGREGVALFEQNDYDIVLTDLLMPGMTGWEVLEAVRQRNPKIPVLIITGSALYPEQRRSWQNGVELVTKPVDVSFLESILAKMLRDAE